MDQDSTAKPGIVITGVSSGIGFALVEALLSDGYLVFGSVRKQQDADKMAKQFPKYFAPLLFDVTDEVAVRKAAEKV